ncbi:MAG: hypothetical protein Q9170_000153 [Blastenia crenularia]
MPSFYPFELPRQRPLTPPEFYHAYPDSAIGPTYRPSHYGSRDLGHSSSSTKSAYTLARPKSTVSRKDDRHSAATEMISSNHATACGLTLSTVPILTPIHVPDRDPDEAHRLQISLAAPAPPIKEEKATGGVAAHLDYEMDDMADFVAETTQGMYDLYESRICLADIDILRSVNPKAAVAPAFRKYVLQVLSSTRLPSSTILLGLHYLATRMNMLSSGGHYPSGKGQVYRLLITALLLGSKFLDDNTFQNRSWSEVSNISVSKLNVLEIEWLVAIGWNLHVDPEDSQGFILWRLHWQRWKANRLEMSRNSLKLRPSAVKVQRLQHEAEAQRLPFSTYPTAYNGMMYRVAIDTGEDRVLTTFSTRDWSDHTRMVCGLN